MHKGDQIRHDKCMFPGKVKQPFVIDYLFLILYVPFKCHPLKGYYRLQPLTDTPGQRPGLLIGEG